MLYILLNMFGIIGGGFFSQYLKKFVNEEQVSGMLLIANLCIAVVGIQGAIQTQNSALMILSAVFGAIVGIALNINRSFQKLGEFLKSKFKTANENFVTGFITVFMIQCIGSMAIIGPLNIGLRNDPSIMIFKIVLDTTSSIIYGAIYGPSVMLSGPFVFLYQATILIFAGFLQPLLSDAVINEISAIGSLLIFAMSLDLLGILKLKVANYLPALLGPILYYIFILIKNS